MYNLTRIQEQLTGLIGYRDHGNSDYGTLDADLTESRSGLFLDTAHPLMDARTLYYAALSLDTQGDTDRLSALINQTLTDSVASVLSAIRVRKLTRIEGKTVLPTIELYDGGGMVTDLITPAGRFVGLKVVVSDPYYAIRLEKLGLQLSAAVTSLPISVYGDSLDNTALFTQNVTTTTGSRMQWVDLKKTLSGYTTYYIGYHQLDLGSVRAIRRAKPVGKVRCAPCEPENNSRWLRWSPHVSLSAFQQDEPFGEVDNVSDQNFGLNLAFSIGCDITNLVIDQQSVLAEAILQQAVVKLLNRIAFSPQITTVEQQTRDRAMYALKNGEEAKLDKLTAALDIDLSGLSAKCLPDTQDVGRVKRKTVYGL
ncbi:hypothetical protein GGR92_005266 [Spirosoma lacussanchae]|uniref:hypothetical protein n=1 Tax=Spirosoma lacussanchae TaxID=1884249 RepID=UPI001107E3EC|nr:hypothetical protein [Spirosoma lacussanchae]